MVISVVNNHRSEKSDNFIDHIAESVQFQKLIFRILNLGKLLKVHFIKNVLQPIQFQKFYFFECLKHFLYKHPFTLNLLFFPF